jgi:hypothetical protein
MALLVAALGLGGCGERAGSEGEGEAAGEVSGVGQEIAGSVASLAQCSDWSAATEEERLATIADIRAQLSQSGSDGPAPQLPDEEAYDVLDRTCSKGYARGLRLYKVYARAAAFAPLAE